MYFCLNKKIPTNILSDFLKLLRFSEATHEQQVITFYTISSNINCVLYAYFIHLYGYLLKNIEYLKSITEMNGHTYKFIKGIPLEGEWCIS